MPNSRSRAPAEIALALEAQAYGQRSMLDGGQVRQQHTCAVSHLRGRFEAPVESRAWLGQRRDACATLPHVSSRDHPPALVARPGDFSGPTELAAQDRQ